MTSDPSSKAMHTRSDMDNRGETTGLSFLTSVLRARVSRLLMLRYLCNIEPRNSLFDLLDGGAVSSLRSDMISSPVPKGLITSHVIANKRKCAETSFSTYFPLMNVLQRPDYQLHFAAAHLYTKPRTLLPYPNTPIHYKKDINRGLPNKAEKNCSEFCNACTQPALLLLCIIRRVITET